MTKLQKLEKPCLNDKEVMSNDLKYWKDLSLAGYLNEVMDDREGSRILQFTRMDLSNKAPSRHLLSFQYAMIPCSILSIEWI